jgi:hypothetical protein
MSLTNGSDTISANLPLTDSGEKSYKSQSNTGTQHGSSLNTCNSRSQNTENALEHGLDVKEEGEKILKLSFLDNGSDVLLRVEDNGLGMEQEVAQRLIMYQAEGYGLKNVNDRICLLYGKDYTIRILSKVGEGTRVEMRIPKGEIS